MGGAVFPLNHYTTMACIGTTLFVTSHSYSHKNGYFLSGRPLANKSTQKNLAGCDTVILYTPKRSHISIHLTQEGVTSWCDPF
jgi:hypothetical protein